ncbi:DgyrCDS4631 [Dimorphilus gyrociliatus]|uniref:DgyrCDS4631 n=1 Tax=Dimorphilus gyrociliatus TaxID=2664684 RepID=A0A7I8VIZ2_9ANNE|nr:DgyrCDS4631 [Dimorphilus gyrociliatus]
MPPSVDWENIPSEILAYIFLKLDQKSRVQCSLVCKNWNEVYYVPDLWRRLQLVFKSTDGQKEVEHIKRYGAHFKHVVLEVDQSNKRQREAVDQVLRAIASFKEKSKIESLTIKFTGQNPWLYSGDEMYRALMHLLDELKERKPPNVLRYFDVSGMQLVMKEDVLLKLAEHPYVETINIATDTLMSSLKAEHCLKPVQYCRRLTCFKAFAISIDDEILKEFCSEGRKPLKFLSLVFQANDKFKVPITDEVWISVLKKNPELKVEYQFDHNCSISIITSHLTPSIPISSVKFITYTHSYNELSYATTLYFQRLEYITIWTPPSDDLNSAIVEAAEKCQLLKSIDVKCELKSETLKFLKESRPDITFTYEATRDDSVVGRSTNLLPLNAQPV